MGNEKDSSIFLILPQEFQQQVPICFVKGAGRFICQYIFWFCSQNQSHSRSEEHTSELQSRFDLVCRLLLEKKTNQHHTELTIGSIFLYQMMQIGNKTNYH